VGLAIVVILVLLIGFYAVVYMVCAILSQTTAGPAFDVPDAPKPAAMSTTPLARAFPVLTVDDGPGRYLICGVERESQTDQRIMVDADSRANAQVKAELRGIIVTEVEKLTRS
jgi:hypothetical protein